MTDESVRIRIGDIVFAFHTDTNDLPISPDEDCRHFASSDPPDVTIEICGGPIPDISPEEGRTIFHSEDRLSIFNHNDCNVIVQKHSLSDSTVERMMVFDREYRRGRLFVRPYPDQPLEVDPLRYPLGQILMVCLLGLGRGLMMHACAVDDNGDGYLFAGNSGHGKSTMAGLWENHARVLNDDRVILGIRDDRFWVHSTPWHGDFSPVSPRSVPLRGVFILSGSETNAALPKEKGEASCLLLTRSFPPLWDKQGMIFTMDFLARLTDQVPCHELQFSPDEDIVDFVRCVN